MGNKCDAENRTVKFEEAKKFAEDHKMQYIEASCKEGTNIKEIFNAIMKYES